MNEGTRSGELPPAAAGAVSNELSTSPIDKRQITCLLALCALLTLLAACGDLSGLLGSEREPPEASMTVEPARGPIPLTVRVDSRSSRGGGEELERELSFDGGAYTPVAENHELVIATPGTFRLTLRVSDEWGNSDTTEATVVAEEGTSTSSNFRIRVVHAEGGPASSVRRAVDEAVGRWQAAIVGDLPDVAVTSRQIEGSCGRDFSYSGVVDDLLLLVETQHIDGSGGVVGMAGACIIRSDGFPLAGVILIDSSDLPYLESSGNLKLVVLHELGHVLDLNHSGWQRRGLLAHDGSGCLSSSSVRFTGSVASREFARVGGSGHVPVEDNGVVGTACSHWDESTFRSELMTGYLDRGARLSRITLGALADMGYRVDMNAADEYSLSLAPVPLGADTGVAMTELLIEPRGMIGPDGEFTPLPASTPRSIDLELPGSDTHDHSH